MKLAFAGKRGSQKAWFTAIAVALGCALAILGAISEFPFLGRIDQTVQDWEIAGIFAPKQPQDPSITIVAIDELTLGSPQFHYRSPVDRAFVAGLLQKIATYQPKAIGLDLLLDQPTEDTKDQALAATLRGLKVPLRVSYIADPNAVTSDQKAYEDAMVPLPLRALANMPTDQFDTARFVFPGAMVDGHYIPGFARALASLGGVSSSPEMVPIIWRGHPPKEVTDTLDPWPFFRTPALLVNFVQNKMAEKWFRGKLVLIGSDVTLVDRHRTPFSVVTSGDEGQLPGILIQAYAVSQLLHHAVSPVAGWPVNLALALLLALMGSGLGASGINLWLRAAVALVIVLAFWSSVIALFHFGDIIVGTLAPPVALTAAFALTDSLNGREARKQRAFIQGAMSRYVPPSVVAQMVEDPTLLRLAGERRVMTYLFSDIENFTTMSEKLEAHELTRLLNAYLNGMTDIVHNHGGTVDKFIGDAVFAIFNAPLDQPDHPQQAVECMLALDDFCQRFRIEEKQRNIKLGVTRIGVHTGPAVVGNFGSEAKFTYTAQGDAVNAASRLEGINKYFGTRLCVSDDTRRLCRGIAFRPVAAVVLKGKTEVLDLWEPLHAGALSGDFLDAYCAAYDQLRQERPEAADLFAQLAGSHPDDPCVALHRRRLAHGDRGVKMVMSDK